MYKYLTESTSCFPSSEQNVGEKDISYPHKEQILVLGFMRSKLQNSLCGLEDIFLQKACLAVKRDKSLEDFLMSFFLNASRLKKLHTHFIISKRGENLYF